MDDNKKIEFRDLAYPLIVYLRKYYHPHAQIIINFDSAEVVEGVQSEHFEYNDD